MSIVSELRDPQHVVNRMRALQLKLADVDVAQVLANVANSNFKRGCWAGGVVGVGIGFLLAVVALWI